MEEDRRMESRKKVERGREQARKEGRRGGRK